MANIFALRDSSLNAFLFSDVGVEANGNGLTILSLLARLGKDPWVEAAAWARKPKNAAIRLLADSISQMPPSQQAFDDANLTASRLVALLPVLDSTRGPGSLPPVLAAIPKSTVLAFVLGTLFLVFSVGLAIAPRHQAVGRPAVDPVIVSAK